jgi:anti-sigma B factor antagonist
MMETFSVRCDHDVAQVTLQLFGELDMASAEELEAELGRVLVNRPRRVTLDLSGLAFCDSWGLAALARADDAARRDGFRLVLRAPSQNLCRLLDIVRLRQLFTIETVQSADRDDIGRCERCGRWQRRRYAYVEEFGPGDREEWCATGNCNATWTDGVVLVMAGRHHADDPSCSCARCRDDSGAMPPSAAVRAAANHGFVGPAELIPADRH